MSEDKEFLSPKHKKLLDIAIWAKLLARLALILYTVLALLVIPQDIVYYQRLGVISNINDFFGLVTTYRFEYALSTISRMLNNLLTGVICYTVLLGISLGLSMIIETDINYRENQGGRDESRTS